MKSNKFLYPVLGFSTGLLMGVFFLGLMSFTPSANSGNDIFPVSVEKAKLYISRYLSGAAPATDVVKGFTIDKSQWMAMNALIKENPSLTGFRIYLGKNENDLVQGIVVGVDGLGKDAVNNTIFGTDAKTISPCPPACETSSPLMQK